MVGGSGTELDSGSRVAPRVRDYATQDLHHQQRLLVAYQDVEVDERLGLMSLLSRLRAIQ